MIVLKSDRGYNCSIGAKIKDGKVELSFARENQSVIVVLKTEHAALLIEEMQGAIKRCVDVKGGK